MSERTFVIVKPDAVARGLVGAILARYEARGLVIEAMRHQMVAGELADAHYAEHVEKPFYPELKAFITGAPVVAAVLSGPGAVSVVRAMNGATDCAVAAPGTIRGDYGLDKTHNLVHGSDSLESASREIALWFPELS